MLGIPSRCLYLGVLLWPEHRRDSQRTRRSCEMRDAAAVSRTRRTPTTKMEEQNPALKETPSVLLLLPSSPPNTKPPHHRNQPPCRTLESPCSPSIQDAPCAVSRPSSLLSRCVSNASFLILILILVLILLSYIYIVLTKKSKQVSSAPTMRVLQSRGPLKLLLLLLLLRPRDPTNFAPTSRYLRSRPRLPRSLCHLVLSFRGRRTFLPSTSERGFGIGLENWRIWVRLLCSALLGYI